MWPTWLQSLPNSNHEGNPAPAFQGASLWMRASGLVLLEHTSRAARGEDQMTIDFTRRHRAGVSALAIAMAVATFAHPTFAQDVAPAAGPAQTATEQPGDSAPAGDIVVTGFRGSIRSAIAAKRNATQIIESISAEDVGKLPDVSITDALARLPGV